MFIEVFTERDLGYESMEGALSVTVIVVGNGINNPIHIEEEAVGIPVYTNSMRKGMNPSLLPKVMNN